MKFHFLFALALLAATPAQAQITAPASTLVPSVTTSIGTLKPSRGALAWISCYNANPVAWLQLFDTTGTPVLGSTVPRLSIPLSATAVTQAVTPAQFLNGIKYAVTSSATGAISPGTGAVSCNFGFN